MQCEVVALKKISTQYLLFKVFIKTYSLLKGKRPATLQKLYSLCLENILRRNEPSLEVLPSILPSPQPFLKKSRPESSWRDKPILKHRGSGPHFYVFTCVQERLVQKKKNHQSICMMSSLSLDKFLCTFYIWPGIPDGLWV